MEPTPALKTPLPEDLVWLTDKVASLVRPAACLVQDRSTVAPLGGTRSWGEPDVPADAPWARGDYRWDCSPYDGESFWLQLNLEDIPAAARKPQWPAAGVVWMFIDVSSREGRWKGHAVFDPRPAREIPWRPRRHDFRPVGARWEELQTLSCATELTVPEVYHWPEMCEVYDEWVADHYLPHRGRAAAQVGGWVWPVQGDHDDRNEDFVCAMEDQPFGDAGAVYLHYSEADGFYVLLDTH